MATIKLTRNKKVEETLEYEIEDGVYYIGKPTIIFDYKYWKVESIAVENSKITQTVECLYMDTVRIIGESLLNNTGNYSFEQIVAARKGLPDSTGDVPVFISQKEFFEIYGKTLENCTKKMGRK